jgi:hypothetical protein
VRDAEGAAPSRFKSSAGARRVPIDEVISIRRSALVLQEAVATRYGVPGLAAVAPRRSQLGLPHRTKLSLPVGPNVR